jgi:AcrR family transcriptional regulator
VRVTAQVKLATEKSIRAAARRLFVRKGFDQTSTREIALAANVAVGTLFNYFPSKEALAIAIAAEAFDSGRARALRRLEERPSSLEEDLFTLIACDIRALQPTRAFIADVLEAGLSPFAARDLSSDAAAIRGERLEDAAAALRRHSLAESATTPVMHLYWALYLGVLSFWAADQSPKQEDTWALLDRSIRMFTGALRPSPQTTGDPTDRPALGVDSSDAAEITP